MFALIANGMLLARTAAGYLRGRSGSELGQDLIEYALLGGVIAVALAALITAGALTGALTSMADGISDCIDFSDAVGSECP